MCTSSSGPYLSSKTRPRRRRTWTSDWSSSKARCMSPYCFLAIACYSYRSAEYSLRVENQIKDITEKSEKRREEVCWSYASPYIKIKGADILQKDRGDPNSPPGINAKARSAAHSCKGVIMDVLRVLSPCICPSLFVLASSKERPATRLRSMPFAYTPLPIPIPSHVLFFAQIIADVSIVQSQIPNIMKSVSVLHPLA